MDLDRDTNIDGVSHPFICGIVNVCIVRKVHVDYKRPAQSGCQVSGNCGLVIGSLFIGRTLFRSSRLVERVSPLLVYRLGLAATDRTLSQFGTRNVTMVKHSARMPLITRPVSAWIVLVLVPLTCGLSLPSPQCLSVQKQKAPNVSSYLYQIQFNSVTLAFELGYWSCKDHFLVQQTSVSSRQSLNVALRSAGTDPFQGIISVTFQFHLMPSHSSE